jgi:N-methylhydantoinase B
MYQAQVERTQCPPWGLLGGLEGLPNAVSLGRADGRIEQFQSGKVNPVRLDNGDSYTTAVGGGGGFWSPLERDPERVVQDVRSGYVSLESAERDYGVIVRQQGRRFTLDRAATEELRTTRRSHQEGARG